MSKMINHEHAADKAFWLLRNTTLTFYQIADFCELDPLEVANIENRSQNHRMGYNPIQYHEITQDDIDRCEQDKAARLPKPIEDSGKKTRKNSKAQKAIDAALEGNENTETVAVSAKKTVKKAAKTVKATKTAKVVKKAKTK